MTPENRTSINADDILDVALHHEIKCRAYELYERRYDAVDNHDLRAELRRVAYAATQLQKYSNGEVGDTRAVRAARVYLRALGSFISEHDRFVLLRRLSQCFELRLLNGMNPPVPERFTPPGLGSKPFVGESVSIPQERVALERGIAGCGEIFPLQ